MDDILPNDKCCLYWIRDVSHTDIQTQGYIGVSTDFEQRIKTHKKQKRWLWKKFDIVVEIILTEKEENCYRFEECLRPEERIGWNINKGGFKPPSRKGKKNRPKTKEEKRMMLKRRIEVAKKRRAEVVANHLPFEVVSESASRVQKKRIAEGRHNFGSEYAKKREAEKKNRGYKHPGQLKESRHYIKNGEIITYNVTNGISFTQWCRDNGFNQSMMSCLWSEKIEEWNGIKKYYA